MEQYPIDMLVSMEQAQTRDAKVRKMIKRYCDGRTKYNDDCLILELVSLYREEDQL